MPFSLASSSALKSSKLNLLVLGIDVGNIESIDLTT